MYCKTILRLFFFFLFIGTSFSSFANEVKLHPHKRVLKMGDQLEWANPDWNDEDWLQNARTALTGKFWVRFEINFDSTSTLIQNKGLSIISIGSYEAYWDGVLIYKNGKVGNSKEEEVPGLFMSNFMLPDSLSKEGNHVLAFRISNFHNTNFKGSWNTFLVEEYLNDSRKYLRLTALMFILAGAYLIAALYFLFLFINDRKEISELLFSFICFIFFGLIVMEFVKFLYAYEYHYHLYRLALIGLLTLSIAFLVPLFLSIHFKIPKKRYFIVFYSILLFSVIYFDNILNDRSAQRVSSMMLVSSMLISMVALYLKRKGSLAILIALILIALLNIFSTLGDIHMIYNYDINLFLGFTILIVSILFSMAQKRKEERIAYESSLLLSVRLKNELLKKNIQPHFIMNTLTSIMEWVEVSPKQSIQFIESLAGEFEILNQIADEKLIPIQQEIDLCKRHLEIMGYRKEIQYNWKENNIDYQQEIPPAIFHTIIENGITHSIPDADRKISFVLNFETNVNQKIYELKCIAENRKSKNRKSGGTGFKYIEARLTESYGDNWELTSGEVEDGWMTRIVVF